MKKVCVILLAVLLFVSVFSACGGGKGETPANQTNAAPTDAGTEEKESPADSDRAERLSLGEEISLPFVEISLESSELKASVKKSITKGNVTRTFGPETESGYQFITLEGTIKNLDKKELPVYDFFVGEFSLDGYTYSCSANECYVYTENGETKSSVEPLCSYRFMICTKVPDALSTSTDRVFRFGFYDLFDNQELAKNRSFEDDPISLCPHQYRIQLLGTADEHPTPETAEMGAPEEAEAPEADNVQKIAMGGKLSQDFVEMTFEKTGIEKDIKKSITKGNVTRNFGPETESGFQFVYLEGKIKNTGKKELPIYDFFTGEFNLDGYTFENSKNQCYIYTENGELISNTVEPMASYSYILFAKVPDELAKSKERSFRFGFYDMFDNYELSKNRSFEDDPISLCPYQVLVDLTAKQSSAAPTDQAGAGSDDGDGDSGNNLNWVGTKLTVKEGDLICIKDGTKIRKTVSGDAYKGIFYEESDGSLRIYLYLKNRPAAGAKSGFSAWSRTEDLGWDLAEAEYDGNDDKVIELVADLADVNEFRDDYYFTVWSEEDGIAAFTYDDLKLSGESHAASKKEWKFSDVFFNTEEDDLETRSTSFSAGPYVLWAHMIVEDGPNTEYLQLKYECNFPNGDVYSGVFTYPDGTDKLYKGADVARSYYYTDNNGNLTNLERGTYTIYFYNLKTGEYVGGKSVTVN